MKGVMDGRIVTSLPQVPDGNLLTHSGESAFRACPRRYQLAYVMGLRPRHDSDALLLGSAVHAGFEVLKNGGDELAAMKAVRDLFADATCPPWLSPEDFSVEEEKAVALTTGWGRHYAGQAFVE